MRKALLLTSIASLSAVSFGCALTDYATGAGTFGVHNKSQGVIGCSTDDRFANTQQTLEIDTRNLLYTSTFNGTIAPGGRCTTGFNPGVTLNNVSSEDARDWNRFIADYAFFGEAQVFSPPNLKGTYILAGAKDLADGSVRLNNYYRSGIGAFSCVGSSVDGRYGGPEGVIVADGLTRLPGLKPDSVAIDSRAGAQFCVNLAAVSPFRATNGFSTYWAFNGRGGEGRVAFTPVTRHEGLAEVLSGQPMTIHVDDKSATVSGRLDADGSITLSILGLAAGGVTYTAETPVKITVTSLDQRTYKVEPTQDELVRLANFAIEAGLTDTTIDLTGKQIQELGVTLPPVQLTIVRATLESFLRGEISGSPDGAPGFGG